ncbi:Uma2 family endonuclease [Alkalibaculum sp. M08DMB]|uniref:Uma2 family endonuclease n=1 Tax=Alkalibaculum sporogenes TaxID=2655001 RepID=A0A6A7K4U6_9FIRM|nr:Uma2 family endonuclease [Alkalibaculum sporogenes]MPW24277.1 Uma2 family endonuclease [Alkalibaculum sporogenes]
MPLPKENKKHTYADYLTWPENEQWEIFNGVPCMQSAPSWQHQAISGELYRQLANHLQGNECQAFTSPFDLRFSDEEKQDEETTNVFQPDIVVICDKSRLKGTGYFGTPTLVIEISSPSTSRIDRVLKFNKYEKSGIKEYWIVDPDGKYVNIFTLQEDQRYGRPESYTEEAKVKVSVFPNLLIDLSQVFASI